MRVRSPLLAQSRLFSSPPVTEMFHFTGCRSRGLWIHPPGTGTAASGLPHSEIHGSKRVGRSPWLIAASRVLRRLAMPRHPPHARQRLSGNRFAPEWCGLPARRSLRHSSGNSAVKDQKGSKAIGERAMVGASPDMVGVTGVGPVTSSLSGTRSNQLSYTPVKGLREIAPWLALHRTTALRRGGGSVQSGWTWKQGTGHWVGRLMDRHRLSSRYVYKGEARPRS